MKKKSMLVMYLTIALVLAHAILVVGCGRNPLMGIIGSNMSVGVGRM